VDLTYFTSERFIHDDLVRQVRQAIPTLYSTWRQQRRIQPFALLWPGESVQTQEGDYIDGTCRLELDDEKPATHRALIEEGAELTKAYAVLYCVQVPEEVALQLSTPHGVHRWSIPVQHREGRLILGTTQDLGEQAAQPSADSPAATTGAG